MFAQLINRINRSGSSEGDASGAPAIPFDGVVPVTDAERDLIQAGLDWVDDPIAFFDRDLVLQFANAAFASWIGRERGTLIGVAIAEAMPVDDDALPPEAVRAYATRSLAGERIELDLAHDPDGSLGALRRVQFRPERRADGEVVGVLCMLHRMQRRQADRSGALDAPPGAAADGESAGAPLRAALRLAQDDVVERDRKQRELIGSLPVPLVFIGNDGNCRWASAAFCRLFGVDESTIPGTPAEKLAGIPKEMVRSGLAMTAGGRAHRMDQRLGLGSAAPRWYRVEFLPGFDRENVQNGAYALFSDVHDSRMTTMRLQESEAHLRGYTETVPEPIVFLDREWCFRYVNESFLKRARRSRDELLGRNIEEVFGRATQDRVRPSLLRAFAGETFTRSARSFFDSDDDFYDTRHVPVKNDGGAVEGVYLAWQTATETKPASERERAVPERDDGTRFLADNVPAEVAYLDAGLRVRYCNRTFRTDYAFQSDGEVLGRTFSELWGAQAGAEAERHCKAALAGERVVFEQRIAQRTSEPRWLAVTLVADLDSYGAARGIHFVAYDLTESRRANELRDRERDGEAQRVREQERAVEREREAARERERGAERDRDALRERERVAEHEREAKRERERSAERDREQIRERERGAEREREQVRERERQAELEREAVRASEREMERERENVRKRERKTERERENARERERHADRIREQERAAALAREDQDRAATIAREAAERAAVIQREDQERAAARAREAEERAAAAALEAEERAAATARHEQERAAATARHEQERAAATALHEQERAAAAALHERERAATLESEAVHARELAQERERAAALERERERVESFVENFREPIAYLDRDGVHRHVNRAYESFAKLGRAAIVARSTAELFGDHVAKQFRPSFGRALKGETLRTELQVAAVGEPERHLVTDWLPDTGSDGKVRGVYLVAQDITDSKIVQRADAEQGAARERELARAAELAREREAIEAFIDDFPQPLAYLDRDGTHHHANRAYEAFVKRGKDAIVSKTAAEVFDEESAERFQPSFERALAGERVLSEHAVGAGDGSTRTLAIHWLPDIGGDSTVRGVYLTVEDVTEAANLRIANEQAQEVARVEAHEQRTKAFEGELRQTLALEFELERAREREAVAATRAEEHQAMVAAHALALQNATEATRAEVREAMAAAHAHELQEVTAASRAEEREAMASAHEIELQKAAAANEQLRAAMNASRGEEHDAIIATHALELQKVTTAHNQQRDAMAAAHAFELETAAARHAQERETIEVAYAFEQESSVSFVENLPRPLAYLDQDGVHWQTNRAYETLVGRDKDDILAKTAAEVFGPEVGELLSPAFERALAGERVRVEHDVALGDAPTRLLALDWLPDRAPDGSVRGIYLAIDDTPAPARPAAAGVEPLPPEHQHALISTFVENFPQPLAYLDHAGVHRHTNRAYETFVRRDKDQIVAKTATEIFGADIADIFRPSFEQALAGERLRTEHEVAVAGEPKRYLAADWLPDLEADGTIRGVYFVVQDITEAKLARRAYEESLREMQRAMDSVSMPISFVDPSGRLRFVNHATMTWHGRSTEELIGTPLAELMSDDDYRFAQPYIDAALGGESVQYEREMRYHDGVRRWVLIRYVATHDEDGHVTGFYTTATDIQSRKKHELALQQANALLSAHFENTPLASFTLDQLGRVSRWSSQAELLFGWSRDEAIERSFDDLGLVDRELVKDFLPRDEDPDTAEGNTRLHVLETKRKDGTMVTCEWHVAALRDASGYITSSLALIQDVSQRVEAERRLTDIAHRDTLTRLLNRNALEPTLRSYIERARQSKTGAAVLFLDLDHFKNINDTLGHRVGDLMLIEIAQILRNNIRADDQVVRIGGDEFMIVIGHKQPKSIAHETAQRILDALSKPIRVDNQRLSVTSSIGIAIYPDHGRASEALVRSADLAMYRAKENGKNRFEFFSAMLAQRSERRSAVKSALKIALQKDALRLHFQPRVRCDNGQIIGAEALLRWTDPRLGPVSPKEFIVIAEESGLIHELGLYVFRKACRQLRDWQERGITLGTLSVNFSAQQLLVATFTDEIDDVIEETGVDPRLIEVEITETSMLFDLGVTRSVIADLKSRGMRIAIDDFGTGFSSLSHLQQLDVDTLKIDQSFIRDMLHDPGDAAITTSVISLAKGLNLSTTAEGVEHKRQLKLLQEAGCDYYQGFLFSPAIVADDIEMLLVDQQQSAAARDAEKA